MIPRSADSRPQSTPSAILGRRRPARSRARSRKTRNDRPTDTETNERTRPKERTTRERFRREEEECIDPAVGRASPDHQSDTHRQRAGGRSVGRYVCVLSFWAAPAPAAPNWPGNTYLAYRLPPSRFSGTVGGLCACGGVAYFLQGCLNL